MYGIRLKPFHIEQPIQKSLGKYSFSTLGFKAIACRNVFSSRTLTDTRDDSRVAGLSAETVQNSKTFSRAFSNCKSVNDDVVFELGDTVIPFSEYATAAFEAELKSKGISWQKSPSRDSCSDDVEFLRISNDYNKELMTQRCFAQCVASLRLLKEMIKSNSVDQETRTEMTQAQMTLFQKIVNILMMQGIQTRQEWQTPPGTTTPQPSTSMPQPSITEELERNGSQFHEESNASGINKWNKMLIESPLEYLTEERVIWSEDPIYISSPFRLSKPLYNYYAAIISDGEIFSWQMPWQITQAFPLPNASTFSRENGAQIFQDFLERKERITKFKAVLSSGIVSSKQFLHTPAKLASCVMTRSEMFSLAIDQVVRLDASTLLSDEYKLSRALCRPLINQYDESIAALCHNYFLPTSPKLYSVKVLSVLAHCFMPMSTISWTYLQRTSNSHTVSLKNFLIDSAITSTFLFKPEILSELDCMKKLASKWGPTLHFKNKNNRVKFVDNRDTANFIVINSSKDNEAEKESFRVEQNKTFSKNKDSSQTGSVDTRNTLFPYSSTNPSIKRTNDTHKSYDNHSRRINHSGFGGSKTSHNIDGNTPDKEMEAENDLFSFSKQTNSSKNENFYQSFPENVKENERRKVHSTYNDDGEMSVQYSFSRDHVFDSPQLQNEQRSESVEQTNTDNLQQNIIFSTPKRT